MDNTINEIIEQINFMLNSSFEEYYRIFIYSFSTYLKSIIKFGITSNQSKESLKTISDFKKILIEERKLLKYLKDNIQLIDLDDAIDVVILLDELNDNTYLEYESLLDNINIAYEINDKNRIIKSNKNIDSLITNNIYKEKVLKIKKKL